MPNDAEMAAVCSRFVEDQSQERLGVHFPAYMLHTEQQNANFFFGTRYNHSTQEMYFIGKPQDRDGHILVVGGAGSGKVPALPFPRWVHGAAHSLLLTSRGNYQKTGP